MTMEDMNELNELASDFFTSQITKKNTPTQKDNPPNPIKNNITKHREQQQNNNTNTHTHANNNKNESSNANVNAGSVGTSAPASKNNSKYPKFHNPASLVNVAPAVVGLNNMSTPSSAGVVAKSTRHSRTTTLQPPSNFCITIFYKVFYFFSASERECWNCDFGIE